MMAFQHIEEAMKMVLVRLESLTYFRLKDYTYYDLKPKFNSIQNAAIRIGISNAVLPPRRA
jgi:hypothetical protein